MTDYTAMLVFRLPDGRCQVEPRRYLAGDASSAHGDAVRDGRMEAQGRTFLGVSQLYESPATVTVDEIPVAHIVASAPDVLDEAGLDVPAEPEVLLSIAAAGEVRWYTLEDAFGPATRVGTHLRRSAARDDAIANDAASDLGSSLVHQGSLYSVTPVALPFVIELLRCPETRPRAILAELMAAIAEHAFADGSDSVLAEVVERGWRLAEMIGGKLVAGSEGTAARIARDVAVLRATREQLRAASLRELAHDVDPGVASRIARALELAGER